MVLHQQYLQVGSSAKNRLFGIVPRPGSGRGTPATLATSPSATAGVRRTSGGNRTPIQMLISGHKKCSYGRLTIVCFGLFTLAIGIILSSIPWVDYIILKQLRLWNGTLSYHYWQKPGVIRLTKVYIFNVTNHDSFLNSGEKPKLQEVGPYVYRENMEKVNIQFHENGTVTYKHHKILNFVPELSVDKEKKLTVPNISLLTLSSQSKSLKRFVQMLINLAVRRLALQPFVHVTPEELVFGYDDPLTALAHTFYPRHKRPMKKLGLLIARNGTGINEVHTIHTGHSGMDNFGYLDRLNGADRLPYWGDSSCSSIRASEGSLFPPRDHTHEDMVYVYDKDLCRTLPMQYKYETWKNGIKAGYYSPPEDVFDTPEDLASNKCFCPEGEVCAPKGLQNISPCQYDAPVFLSFPHFYKADPALLDAVDGMKPVKENHETYFKIQTKLGVPVEGKVRVQLNLRVTRASHISAVAKFPDIVFPIMWLEEGIAELPPAIHRWVYLATTVADTAVPILTYGLTVVGAATLVTVFVCAYKSVVFSAETLERGKQTIRRGSSFIVSTAGQHGRLMIVKDSYTLLENMSGDPDPEAEEGQIYEVDL